MAYIRTVDYLVDMLENSKCYQLALNLSKYEKKVLKKEGFKDLVRAVNEPMRKLTKKDCKKAIKDVEALESGAASGLLKSEPFTELLSDTERVMETAEKAAVVVEARCKHECYSGDEPETEEEWQNLLRSARRGTNIGRRAAAMASRVYRHHIRVGRIINASTKSDQNNDAGEEQRNAELRRLQSLRQILNDEQMRKEK